MLVTVANGKSASCGFAGALFLELRGVAVMIRGLSVCRKQTTPLNMRFAIFGDIHANLEALEAVLADARSFDVTHFACLGDVVGYNANPSECVELVRQLGCPVVKGNHDEQASEDTDLSTFNSLAAKAIQWTRDNLSEVDKQWLRDLKFSRIVRDFTVTHATLDTPAAWGYVLSALEAAASFNYQNTQVCFYGHTHVPVGYVKNGVMVEEVDPTHVAIEAGKKYFLNVGSVGQPRDGDPRASYAIYSPSEKVVVWRRVEYPIERVQQKIRDAGLPERLALRLGVGK